MTSEIRANTIKNRVGLGTVSYTNTGIVVSGIVTARNGVDATGTSIFRGALQAQDNLEIAGELVHLSDNDTRIRFPANDTISFQTAGDERARIDSSGSIGIKNTSPNSQYFNNLVIGDNNAGDWGITIRTSSSNKGVLAFSDSDAADANRYDGYIAYQHSDQSMRFHTGGANERVRITSDGKVGISSVTPDAPLTIYTAASQAWKFRINTSVSDGAGFYQRSNGDFELVLRDASNNNNYIVGSGGELQFATSGSERLRIESGGGLKFTGQGTSIPVGGILH
ncbi:MAG: hypothetical protein VXY93_11735, partial [Pseudomonadota bacterium]|nr:hypothetical protein [Pseudomonadota bacterium]